MSRRRGEDVGQVSESREVNLRAPLQNPAAAARWFSAKKRVHDAKKETFLDRKNICVPGEAFINEVPLKEK